MPNMQRITWNGTRRAAWRAAARAMRLARLLRICHKLAEKTVRQDADRDAGDHLPIEARGRFYHRRCSETAEPYAASPARAGDDGAEAAGGGPAKAADEAKKGRRDRGARKIAALTHSRAGWKGQERTPMRAPRPPDKAIAPPRRRATARAEDLKQRRPRPGRETGDAADHRQSRRGVKNPPTAAIQGRRQAAATKRTISGQGGNRGQLLSRAGLGLHLPREAEELYVRPQHPQAGDRRRRGVSIRTSRSGPIRDHDRPIGTQWWNGDGAQRTGRRWERGPRSNQRRRQETRSTALPSAGPARPPRVRPPCRDHRSSFRTSR